MAHEHEGNMKNEFEAEGTTMTPTIEEVSGWLREAAFYVVDLADECLMDEAAVVQAVFNDRVAQVEAMGWPKTCDTCELWDNSPWKVSPERRLCLCQEEDNDTESWGFVDDCGPKFGCIHHKQPPVNK